MPDRNDGSDGPTPPRKRRTPVAGVKLSSDDRALAELSRRATSRSDATPREFEDREEITKPNELIDLERYRDDPNYRREWDEVVEQFNQNAAYRVLWNRFGRYRRESGQASAASANAALITHEDAKKIVEATERVNKLEAELHDVHTVLRITKWILGLVIAATLASVIAVFTKVFNWGLSTGGVEIRLQHLERDVGDFAKKGKP